MSQDASALARDANKALRESQREMFSGKLEQAQTHLAVAAELIAEIRSVDPGFAQLRGLESKYERQKKDLDRRLARTVQAKAATTAQEPDKADVSEGPAPARDASTLAREADKALRESQRMMFGGKLKQAKERFDAAAELMSQIRVIAPGSSQLKSLEGRYEKQKKDLDRRLGVAEAPAAASAATPSAAPASDKLPGGVTHRLKEVDSILQGGDRVLSKGTAASGDREARELERIVGRAGDVMEEIVRRYGDQIPDGHPEVKARQDRLAAFQDELGELRAAVADREAAAAAQEERREAQSQEWRARIKPYITGLGQPGYDESQYLIASGTADVEELMRRKAIYDRAAALFAEYEEADFPAGKTDELERAEKDLAYALDCFSSGYEGSVAGFFARAREQIEQAVRWLTQEEAKDDGERQPLLLQKDIVPNVKEQIATAAAAVPTGDVRIAELDGKLADIESRAGRLRELRTERTFMTPDKFTGEELDDVKAKAVEVLGDEHPGAQALCTTVISGDWKEERVLEYTDTTETEVRYRVTHSVTAQVAGKRGSDVFLYTIHVARDELADGSWGSLYGNVMFTDPMLEENAK